MATHDDPRYKEEARKLRLLVSAASGEEVQKLVEGLATAPRRLYDRYAAILANENAEVAAALDNFRKNQTDRVLGDSDPRE